MPPESRNAKRCSLPSAEGTGTTTRGAKVSRMGLQTLANGWPLSYTSCAHVGVCGSVRILSTDNLEGDAARRAVEGEQWPVYVEGKVVPRQARKKHGLPSFTISSLRQRCDRPEGRAPSWRIRASVGGIPAHWVGRRAVIDKWGTWALAITVRKKSRPMRPTSRAVLQRSNLCAMKRAICSSLVFGANPDAR